MVCHGQAYYRSDEIERIGQTKPHQELFYIQGWLLIKETGTLLKWKTMLLIAKMTGIKKDHLRATQKMQI